MDLYQTNSGGGPGVQNGPAVLKNEIYLKIFSVQELEICYVAWPGGPDNASFSCENDQNLCIL